MAWWPKSRHTKKAAHNDPVVSKGVNAVCGHPTRGEGEMTAFGVTITTRMPRLPDGTYDYCLRCLGEMAIRCAWCGEVIFIGDPVTLYSPRAVWVRTERMVAYSEDPLQFVGCLGWDCAQTGGDRAGFWLPDPNSRGRGYVFRVLSPMEVAFSTGKPILVADLGNMSDPTVIPIVDHSE